MPTDLKEFDDLIAALKDERPQIDPGFARELDTRAAAGFAKPRRRWLRLPRVNMMVGAPAAAFAVLIAVVVAASQLGGTGGDDLSTSDTSGGSVAAAPEPQMDALEQSAGADARAGEIAPSVAADRAKRTAGTAPSAGPDRLVEQSASLTLAAPAKEISSVGDEILATTDELGGFVVSSSVRATDGNGGSGEFQLRLPAKSLDAGIARLSAIAHVRERRQGVLDITSERNVSRENLQEARAERVSLLDRLAAATTDTEAAALQAQIDNINVAIGRYRADLTRVLRRARYALVSVSLVAAGRNETAGPADDGKWTPGDALRDAGRVLEVAAGVLVILGAVLIPLLLLGLAVVVTRRVAGRRGRERMLDAV